MTNGKQLSNWVPILLVIVALLGTNGIFAGWYSNALNKLTISVSADIAEVKNTFKTEINDIQEQINNRFRISGDTTERKINAANERCNKDILGFLRIMEKNSDKLDEVGRNQNKMRVVMQDFKTKQDMVLRKINLGDNTNSDFENDFN